MQTLQNGQRPATETESVLMTSYSCVCPGGGEWYCLFPAWCVKQERTIMQEMAPIQTRTPEIRVGWKTDHSKWHVMDRHSDQFPSFAMSKGLTVSSFLSLNNNNNNKKTCFHSNIDTQSRPPQVLLYWTNFRIHFVLKLKTMGRW